MTMFLIALLVMAGFAFMADAAGGNGSGTASESAPDGAPSEPGVDDPSSGDDASEYDLDDDDEEKGEEGGAEKDDGEPSKTDDGPDVYDVMARDLGIPEASLPKSPDEKSKVLVSAIEKQLADLGYSPDGRPLTTPAETPKYRVTPTKYQTKLNQAEYDERFINEVQAIADHVFGESEQVYGLLEQVARALNQQMGAMESLEIDRWFDALADEYGEELGRGPTALLDPASDAFKNRKRLLDEFHGTRALSAFKDQPIGQLYRRAASVAFADKVAEKARKKIVKQMESRQSSSLHRPGKRTGGTGESALGKLLSQDRFRDLRGDGMEEDDEI